MYRNSDETVDRHLSENGNIFSTKYGMWELPVVFKIVAAIETSWPS